MRLLFIESDPSVHRWLEAQAQALGIEVLCARDDQSALEVLAGARPDAVVADVGSCPLPGASGWQHLGRVLNARFIPLLVYASSRHLATVAARVGRRCGGALPSPFTLATAVHRARWVIARRRAREARTVANTQFVVPAPARLPSTARASA